MPLASVTSRSAKVPQLPCSVQELRHCQSLVAEHLGQIQRGRSHALSKLHLWRPLPREELKAGAPDVSFVLLSAHPAFATCVIPQGWAHSTRAWLAT